MDDRELLREFVGRHSEPAFAELVARHLPGVLATAQRLVREPHTAADVAQTVFIQLARKAWTIRDGQMLSGWLYRTTQHTALKALRLEQRRRQRETIAMNNAEMQTGSEPGWEHLAPLVDEAMRQLKRHEQDVVLLRFFEGKSFGEIGRLLNLDEKTAGQRANRALEKMRLYFSRRGVTTTAVLLGSALGANAATALPASLASQVTGASLANAGGSASLAVFLKTLYMTTTTKIILAGAVLVAVATVSTISQQREISQLRAELAAKNTGIGSSAFVKDSKLLSPAKLLAQILRTPGSFNRNIKLADYIEGLDGKAVKALVDELAAEPRTSDNLDILNDLVHRWAELDPQATLAWVEGIHDSREITSYAEQLFEAWSAQNPAAAFAALTQLRGNIDNHSTMFFVINNFARENPQAAVAAINSLPPAQQSSDYGILFSVWASQDPSAAATAALKLAPSQERIRALNDIANAWAKQDPADALAWANTLPPGSDQNYAVTSAIEAIGAQDPVSAVNYASQLPAGPNRDGILYNVTQNWAQQDPASLLTWADKNLTGTTFDTATLAALNQMGMTDPATAEAALANISDPNVVNEAIPKLAINWAQQDPQAALAWAQSLPTDNVAIRNLAISDVLTSWTTTNPATAATYIQQNLTTDPAFNTLATQVVNSWGAIDPQAALTWAESLPQGTAQNSAVVAAITTLARADPQTAWNDAQQLPDSSVGEADVNIINTWASQQPAQAAQALQSLPEGSSLNTATVDVAKSWLNQDPAAATQWIDTLPQGSARDGAVTQIIASVGTNDPASAFPWALSIGNPTTENAQIVKLATQWSNQNPSAAAAAVQGAMGNLTGLTQAQQNALQKVLDKAAGP